MPSREQREWVGFKKTAWPSIREGKTFWKPRRDPCKVPVPPQRQNVANDSRWTQMCSICNGHAILQQKKGSRSGVSEAVAASGPQPQEEETLEIRIAKDNHSLCCNYWKYPTAKISKYAWLNGSQNKKILPVFWRWPCFSLSHFVFTFASPSVVFILLFTFFQVSILNLENRLVFLSGPPGSGKTLILRLKAEQWAKAGNNLIIININHGSKGLPLGHLMEQQV